MRRKRLSRKRSRKNFRNGTKTNRKNGGHKPMRGGYRL